VFVCENNQYAELTPAMEMQPVPRIASRVGGYGMPSVVCDGMDVMAVASAARECLGMAYEGRGPVFLEAETYRYSGHMTGDPQQYRTSEEVDRWRGRDPIQHLERSLIESGMARELIETISDDEQRTISAAADQAAQEPTPEPAEIWESAPSWSLATR
jgi:acetoin:2,6-dichlorophenolindophenol oxidoreductase subunit alpha